MWLILLMVILVWSGIGLKGLRKKGSVKDMATYIILWAIGTTGLMLYRFGISIPTPLDGIAYIYHPLSSLWKQWFA
ncbi:hypothetical protein SAMN05421743_102189 [Thalassobacillus cyri]|uniref:Uncharacterized protein n=1 Tax=Thalassobacillus cyri TaxID=571932 RepID=A0A1H3XNN3_9BACI|nr:hypothetical protein [Thalassobacillus cyri]SEA00214.1 hypothetical protein SAMN05421743_102189 [Thalassobacillus cyri]